MNVGGAFQPHSVTGRRKEPVGRSVTPHAHRHGSYADSSFTRRKLLWTRTSHCKKRALCLVHVRTVIINGSLLGRRGRLCRSRSYLYKHLSHCLKSGLAVNGKEYGRISAGLRFARHISSLSPSNLKESNSPMECCAP